jgi:hypothetical protein
MHGFIFEVSSSAKLVCMSPKGSVLKVLLQVDSTVGKWWKLEMGASGMKLGNCGCTLSWDIGTLALPFCFLATMR